MRICEFSVRGYKNIVDEVRLTDLGAINVIHGDNNVGKSNLLEAMDLFFFLLGVPYQNRLAVGGGVTINDDDLKRLGHARPVEIFNLHDPQPIALEAIISLTEDEMPRFPGAKGRQFTRMTIGFRVVRQNGQASYELTRFELADHTDVKAFDVEVQRERFVGLSRALATDMTLQDKPAPRYRVIGIGQRLANLATKTHVAADTLLALYDAKESLDVQVVGRWHRFTDAMAHFTDVSGGSTWTAVYDRKENAAELVLDDPTARIPLRLMGSGVQQLAGILGLLQVSNADIVALEEPELNLRVSVQERLRDILRDEIVGKPGGPRQMFITSHSAAFEVGEGFYWMRVGDRGHPIIERAPTASAVVATGQTTLQLPAGSAPLLYASTEGTVRLPDRVRARLGVALGGGLMVIDSDRDETVELMSASAWAERFGHAFEEPPKVEP